MAESLNQNPALARLSWVEEVVFRRLFLAADNYGNFPADPDQIKARCFPHQHNRISRETVMSAIMACSAAGLCATYSDPQGVQYVHIFSHGQQAKARPRYPLPPPDLQPSPQQAQEQGEQPPQGTPPQKRTKTPPAGAPRPRWQRWNPQTPPPPKNYNL